MWFFFAFIIVALVFFYSSLVRSTKLKDRAKFVSESHVQHEKADNEFIKIEKETEIIQEKTLKPIITMKDDNENKGPGGPNEPGAAGGDMSNHMQRDVNITETPKTLAFSVKGYTVDNIASLITAEENNLKYDNQDHYIGEIWDGWRHGVGKYDYDKDGSMYFGEWVLGTRHGKGLFIWHDGERYEGEWVFGKMHGKGKYFYLNGDYYEGEWITDFKQGHGDYEYKSSGSRYSGSWLGDKRNGKGTFWWSNGDYYEGEWSDSKMCGYGVYVFATGDRFEGNWMEDKRNGYGIYIYENGDRFEGNWIDGNRTGAGIYYYDNGDIYEGDFRDNEFHGIGKFSYVDGRIDEGLWDTGNLVKPV
jgi:hypothetical protein